MNLMPLGALCVHFCLSRALSSSLNDALGQCYCTRALAIESSSGWCARAQNRRERGLRLVASAPKWFLRCSNTARDLDSAASCSRSDGAEISVKRPLAEAETEAARASGDQEWTPSGRKEEDGGALSGTFTFNS
jgi:hypothetical protein